MSVHILPVKVYVRVFVALMVGLAITVWVATQDLGTWNTIVAMTIAVAKAMVVALFFMHLRYSSRLTMIWAGAGVFFLLILFALTMGDFDTRWFQVKGW
ncbi:MAG: cytochrome C oxidase subunit IV family protein [Armatimonadetes bacterium]|nr:cytochrome C oxidase subunit IV family protein [Armatimonadota bacterium]